MASKIIIYSFVMWMCCSIGYSGDFRERVFRKNGACDSTQYRCLNSVCINRNLFCNSVNNCGDNSDEEYCSSQPSGCPVVYPFYQCNRHPSYNLYNDQGFKCIPTVWKCDGVNDCPSGDDETSCDNLEITLQVKTSREKATSWILDQAANKTSTDQWGPHVRKTSVALYLADLSFTDSYSTFSFLSVKRTSPKKDMAYELSIQLLSRLALRRLKDVSTSDLASFINALLVTCLDPRKFHSVNLVKELRSRVNAQNYTIPYDMLALCNAGEKITKKDIEKLKTAFSSDHREFWTETQAIAVMALVCAGNQPGSGFPLSQLADFTMELKQKQYRNGTVENLQTTALVMQALFASEHEDDENNFDEEKALQQILREQKEDGSFGNVINTYYVLPVLNYRSLVNISSDHCASYTKDGDTALQDLLNLSSPKIRVRYSLWIGDDRDVDRTLKLKVPANTSLYGIMEVAGDIDSQFRFQYVVKNGKPYINTISGIQDDPESGRFWFPYILNGTKHSPVDGSPADLMPKDNDHVVMWYQSGSWIE